MVDRLILVNGLPGAGTLAATRPDWTFELRPGVGHLLAIEDPEWTAERISAVLERDAQDAR